MNTHLKKKRSAGLSIGNKHGSRTQPISEQQAIAGFLGRELAHVARMTDKVEMAADRLQEYRCSLITHAVTGQIDVRQVPIPEEPHHA